MTLTAYTNAHLVCPAAGLDGEGALLVEDGRIAAVGADIPIPDNAQKTDCRGQWLLPGLIDMQVSTGEPGAEYRETLATASRAAASGGVTGLVLCANTQPAIDDAALVDFLIRRARATSLVHAYPMAALSRGLKGKAMSEFALLAEAGAVAFSDAPHPVMDAMLMRRALHYAGALDALLVAQPLEARLAGDGVMHEGEIASRLGLMGIPAAAETIMIARDIQLAALTGARLHLAQLSAAASVDLVRAAKAQGLPISCGVSVHHLLLTQEAVADWRSFAKLRPPLRSEADRQSLIAGVADGTIDVVVSGHDPQDVEAKRLTFAEADYGSVGVETLLAAALTLWHEGAVPRSRLVDALAAKPAQILRLPGGCLMPKQKADFCLVNPHASWTVNSERMLAKSKNTALDGKKLRGKVLQCFVGGRKVFPFA